jgi:hypothetical protein
VTDPEDGETFTIGGQSGPLHDPTAILYVRKSDLDPVSGKLKPGVPVEPLVLRAAAGDCINITLENRLPTVMPDLAQMASVMGMVKRDRNGGEGSTTFSNNLLRPSSTVGLHAQLLAYDITKSDGTNVGTNPIQTVPPRVGNTGAYPTRTYQYYAGHLEREGKPITQLGRSVDNINATAIEFGGLNFTPADVIKQPQKGLGGAMSILPMGATWVEDARKVNATVTAPGQTTYRDFAMVWQKALNMRWANGRPVEGIAAEAGVPTDPQDNSSMAINYKTEPMWFRFGLPPDAPFGQTRATVPHPHPDAHRWQPWFDLSAGRSRLVGQPVPVGEERHRRLPDGDPRRGFSAVRLQPDVDVHRRPRKHPAGGALQLHAPECRGQQRDTGRLPVP